MIINFSEFKEINSVGCLGLMRFINDWGTKALEFHKCPIVLLDMINMIPNLLGQNQDPKIIKSLEIPYVCDEHGVQDIMMDTNEVKIKGGEVTPPDRKCPTCQKTMELDEDLDVYSQILTG